MLIDKQNQFSDSQSLVVNAATPTASTNIVDLGVARDVGGAATDQLMLLCQIVTAFAASGGAAELQVDFQTAPDNGSGAPGTWVTLASSGPVAKASLVQGYKFLPGELAGPTQRFVRLLYTVTTNNGTAGAITAALVPSLDVTPTYARGYAA
jgi:hypothetical protein